MPSMKAKKGNPFEYDTAYSLQQAGYEVNRIDDNTKGIDLVATKSSRPIKYYIECKNREKLSWNQLTKFYEKLIQTSNQFNDIHECYLIFKSNRQPTLVMYVPKFWDNIIIEPFNTVFGIPWSKRPKGYKIWQN